MKSFFQQQCSTYWSKTVMLFNIVLISTTTLFAQEINKSKLDSLFDGLAAHNKFMGSVSLFRDGNEIYSKSVGYRDIANKIPADIHTKYRIGSITKTFTAVLVMKAVENGKLSLNQTLDKWFPQINYASQITIRQLLSHRSGIANFTNDTTYLQWNTDTHAKDALLARIIKSGTSFLPGEKFEYSNSAFVLLGWIIEKSYGMSYAKAIEKYILKPGGLTETAIGAKIDVGNNQSLSYTYQDSWKPFSETDMSVPFSAGALISTPSDINRFAYQLSNGKFISLSSVDTMKVFKDGVGLGMFMIPFNEKKAFGHTGGIDAFQSVYAYFPNEKVGYALTSNGTNFVINDISIKVLSAVFGFDFPLPLYEGRVLKPEDLEPYLGTYASTKIPLKITFFREGNKLMSQATGQIAFELQAFENHTFRAEQYGIEVQFNPAQKTMVLRQSGSVFLFSKE